MRFRIVLPLVFILASAWAARAADAPPPELPKPTFRNCFYLVPIHEAFNAKGYTDAQREKDMAALVAELGPPRLYRRIGFSGSTPPAWGKGSMAAIIPLLKKHGLVWHSHHHLSTHTIARHPEFLEAVKKDRRNALWRHDGSARGGLTSWDAKAMMTEGPGRAAVLACASRLNKDLIAARLAAARWLNDDMEHAKYARVEPHVMVSAGHSVENELAPYPFPWGCFSPYSVAEFQMWLRHTGLYDATASRFRGQGAQESVIGKLIQIAGALRSQFYDDPSPRDAGGTGVSFNEFFGTDFDTWKLEYWDLDDYPPGTLAWNDDLSNPLPGEGQKGNAKGKGFDAPRLADPNNRFFRAFSNEDPAAKGYRQFSIWAWNVDTGRALVETGFPIERIFAHQIPAEVLGPLHYFPLPEKLSKQPHLLRRFTTASPSWTCDDHLGDFGGYGAGITAFHEHAHDEALFARVRAYDANWAILEYHPDGHVDNPDYDKCLRALRLAHKHRVHVLAPGWWDYKKAPFVIQGTGFAKAMKDWMNDPTGQDESDQPLGNDKPITYAPPQVQGVRVAAVAAAGDQPAGTRVTWSKLMWDDVYYADWPLWREFAGGTFTVYRSENESEPGRAIATVCGDKFEYLDTTAPAGKTCWYRVAANRTKGAELTGRASEAAKVE